MHGRRFFSLIGALGIVVTGLGQANADLITGSIYLENFTAADTLVPPAGSPNATFALGIGSTINYLSTGANYTVGGFLGSNGNSATINPTSVGAHNLNNTLFVFTGTTALVAGNNTITMTSDDGSKFTANGQTVGITRGTQTGATYTITAATAGTYSFSLAYGETNGAPASLIVSVNGVVLTSTVPEPATVAMALTALPLLGLGAWARRRRNKV